MLKQDIKEKGAIVQRDRQTYAIVPHTPAGLISREQLRKIADVADKYQVPMIKVTSAQRLALIGLKETDIAAAWQDLDEPIGYTTGLCVRSIKICPGTDCCKRGLQDSIGVGLEMDKQFHGRPLPWKMKMAVSGCPNDCGETCIRDVGLIGTPRGWQLMVGGNGGSRPRLSQRLLENILDDEQALAAVQRLVDWFELQGRKCRLGKLLEEVTLDELRLIALGEVAAD
jgi:NAD(P)H-nitrite reductase large subunit